MRAASNPGVDYRELVRRAYDACAAAYGESREEHGALFRRIWRWLRPGGLLLCTLSHRNENAYTEEDFFGVTMYWSNYGLAENLEMLSEVGFEVLEVSSTSGGWADEVEAEAEDHPLVLARKVVCGS